MYSRAGTHALYSLAHTVHSICVLNIRSGDRIFDLEIELSLFNTFRLILMIKQMFPLCFGKSRSRSVICPLRQITLNAFKIDEMSNPVNARSLLLMQI